MTAINHALTGAVIGLVAGRPEIALPAALVSHFLCDAVPHYGAAGDKNAVLRSKAFARYLLADAGMCGLLVLAIAITKPQHWLLAISCAFLAAAPDSAYITKFRRMRQHRSWKPGAFTRFAIVIQWFERPLGGLVEVAWFVAAVALIIPFVAR